MNKKTLTAFVALTAALALAVWRWRQARSQTDDTLYAKLDDQTLRSNPEAPYAGKDGFVAVMAPESHATIGDLHGRYSVDEVQEGNLLDRMVAPALAEHYPEIGEDGEELVTERAPLGPQAPLPGLPTGLPLVLMLLSPTEPAQLWMRLYGSVGGVATSESDFIAMCQAATRMARGQRPPVSVITSPDQMDALIRAALHPACAELLRDPGLFVYRRQEDGLVLDLESSETLVRALRPRLAAH